MSNLNPTPEQVAAALIRTELLSGYDQSEHIRALERQLRIERQATNELRKRVDRADRATEAAEHFAATNAKHEERAWGAFACAVSLLCGVVAAWIVWATQ